MLNVQVLIVLYIYTTRRALKDWYSNKHVKSFWANCICL